MTHLLLGDLVRRATPQLQFSGWAIALGSLLPDVPIMATALWCGMSLLLSGEYSFEAFRLSMDARYFVDGWVSAGHNLFHSPLSLLTMAVVARLMFPRAQWRITAAFLCGAALHSAVDIVTHANDGPLLFWPVERSIRFHSPFSHWDLQSGAAWVLAAEMCVWVLWLIVVRYGWLGSRSRYETA